MNPVREGDGHNTLARTHSLAVEVAESALDGAFRSAMERCAADIDHHCTVLASDLSAGDRPSGSLQLRIDPGGVEAFSSFAAGLGRLRHRSTNAEDLAESIADTRARVAMLTNYRKQLLDLQAKSGNNVEAAIKVASELSSVQSDLEKATGEEAYQVKRTATEILRLEFEVGDRTAFWRPPQEALEQFAANFSMGLSAVITAFAFIIPWLILILPALYLLRWIWRRRR